jgi:Na+-transporting NADH:ubiquinone oxidoreductase subunit NqrC
MGFSKKIKEYFGSKGLTNREVARIMDNYSEVSVGRYVNSDEISKTFIKKLRKYFPDADLNYLTMDDDEKVDTNILNEPAASYNPDAIRLVMEIEERLNQLKEILAQKSHQK